MLWTLGPWDDMHLMHIIDLAAQKCKQKLLLVITSREALCKLSSLWAWHLP